MFGNAGNRHRHRNLLNGRQCSTSGGARSMGCGLGLGRGRALGRRVFGLEPSQASLKALRDDLAQLLEEVDALLSK